MADIVNTLRGPKFFKPGTIVGRYYIIPVRHPLTTVAFDFTNEYMPRHEREYYKREADGEWHWSHTETPKLQKFPCYQEPEHCLPEGV